MSEVERLLETIGERELIEFVTRQRWFGSKSREGSHAAGVDSAVLRDQEPLLADGLVEVRFQPGTHETYQVLCGFRPARETWEEGVIAAADGWTAYDALADPALA